MNIRYITPYDDKFAVSNIYEQSWKYTYKGIIPEQYLNSIQKGKWVSNLYSPHRKTLICIENNVIAGTVSFGKSRFEQFVGFGEIISLYLLPDYMGKGYGKALLKSAIVELKDSGYEDIFLWVLEENKKARHFYEKEGFLSTDIYMNNNIGGKNLLEIGYVYHIY